MIAAASPRTPGTEAGQIQGGGRDATMVTVGIDEELDHRRPRHATLSVHFETSMKISIVTPTGSLLLATPDRFE